MRSLEDRLDGLEEEWWELRKLHTEAMVKHGTEGYNKTFEQMREIKRQQIIVVAESLGFKVEFDNPGNTEKFYLKKRSTYRGLAFFEGGRLKAMIKANRSDTMRLQYLINGQAYRGCKNIYWRPWKLN